MSTVNKTDLSIISDEEIRAQDLVKRNEIDQAIAVYQQLQPESARILNIIGRLYAEKKGDCDLAINYHERALQIQEKNGDDTSDTLTELGLAQQNRGEFDLALVYHSRALSIRELADDVDQKLVVTSLFGIANAYWGQENLSEALRYAQQALTINESMGCENELNIAANLAILANIYYNSDDSNRALELAKQALILFERCVPPNSSALSSVLNNIATIQVSLGLFNDALLTFIRVLHICEQTLPSGHPKRVVVEDNIRRMTETQQYNDLNPFAYIWKFLPKILFF